MKAIYKGDSRKYTVTFRDKKTKKPIDITNKKIYAKIAPKLSDADTGTDISLIPINTTDHTKPKEGRTILNVTGTHSNKTPRTYIVSFAMIDTVTTEKITLGTDSLQIMESAIDAIS